jgi:ankyrin repeat protein
LEEVLKLGLSPNSKFYLYLQNDSAAIRQGEIHRLFFGSEYWSYPIETAIQSNNVLALKVLLDYGANPRLTDYNGNSVLSSLPMYGNGTSELDRMLPIITMLAAHGADVNTADGGPSGLLEQAMWDNSPKAVDELLKLGVKPSSFDFARYLSLLHIKPHDVAQEDMNRRLVQALDRNTVCNYSEEDTWVQYCLSEKMMDAATILLNAGYPPDNPNDANSAIGCAAAQHEDSIIPLLIKHGANVNIAQNPDKEQEGTTPLSSAAGAGDFAVTKMLIDHGAAWQNEPLVALAAPSGNLQFIQYLLHLESTGGYGGTYQRAPVIQEVIDAPLYAILNQKSSSNSIQTFSLDELVKAAAGVTISEQRNQIAKLLVEKGYYTPGETDDDHSILFYAIICNDTKLVSLFTMYGAKIQPSDPADMMALKIWNERHPDKHLPIAGK